MTDQNPDAPVPFSDDPFLSESPVMMTLERIIALTGEIEHLNDLVLVHLDCNGGFSGTGAYFSTVRPILDRLELEIRTQYEPGMTRAEIKGTISTWIDQEICSLQ